VLEHLSLGIIASRNPKLIQKLSQGEARLGSFTCSRFDVPVLVGDQISNELANSNEHGWVFDASHSIRRKRIHDGVLRVQKSLKKSCAATRYDVSEQLEFRRPASCYEFESLSHPFVGKRVIFDPGDDLFQEIGARLTSSCGVLITHHSIERNLA